MADKRPLALQCRADIGLVEVCALEQKRDVVLPRERVGEAVAEIQSGRMVALAKPYVGFTRDAHLGEVHWDGGHAQAFEECVG